MRSRGALVHTPGGVDRGRSSPARMRPSGGGNSRKPGIIALRAIMTLIARDPLPCPGTTAEMVPGPTGQATAGAFSTGLSLWAPPDAEQAHPRGCGPSHDVRRQTAASEAMDHGEPFPDVQGVVGEDRVVTCRRGPVERPSLDATIRPSAPPRPYLRRSSA
jgi:hypothetical protein